VAVIFADSRDENGVPNDGDVALRAIEPWV
jgi:hypothetical protein